MLRPAAATAPNGRPANGAGDCAAPASMLLRDTAVGVWHETYTVGPGSYENIYSNMPRFGLGAVGNLVEATGKRERAGERLRSAS